ncbi:putative OGDH E1 component DHKTD1, mitochondrial [Chionoecetes opilio]|uniref:Putative OGDH E1 component DHKTD1, mitochondrial n=1 Tax=Chionoecetes opilio TaxID=41210 RepID=A0A8J4XQP1_CHIOP|nr:putative OGDH E1 component DHKTD1, mitochondrial [Chionoecetes opilio]
MSLVRTAGRMAVLRRAFTTLHKPLTCGGVYDLCPVLAVGHVRGYQSMQGVYGFKYKEPRSFTLPDDIIQQRTEESNLFRWVSAFREFGHLTADINPIQPNTRQVPELEPELYGLSRDASYNPRGLVAGCEGSYNLQQLQDTLKEKYCGHIGVEFAYLPTLEEREWFANAVESLQDEVITSEERIKLAGDMLRSQAFDNFLGTKFQSVKRYGAEGGESMMSFFTETFRRVAQEGVEHMVVGMAHRGRLNLLTGLLHYPPALMFKKMKGMPEFPENVQFIGDVLSHLCISLDLEMGGENPLHVTLLPNPSHLEAVNPVACGKTRARQRSLGEGCYSTHPEAQPGDKVMCLQVHGDAALGGQGVIQETLAFSAVPHFEIGGALHISINNQIGYTTPGERTRSSQYCTDVAKMCSLPVIHVNGDQPEAVVKAARLAVQYQRKFRRDVFVDLLCWRRWGHNELDNPRFTNPLMYHVIDAHRSVPDIYADQLVEEGVMGGEEVKKVTDDHVTFLTEQFKLVESTEPKAPHLEKQWAGFVQAPSTVQVWDTGVDTKSLHGQDVGRGTFSQRHCMLVDQETDEMHIPLNHIDEEQSAKLEVANSILSEEAVLGFEYGMSVESPNTLCIWEAQFGDFYNGAQIMIDTFVSSGEAKWLLQSCLTMVLPHGYDGAGPEHSSCHMERFLQNSSSSETVPDGENVNWCIVNPTTPAQYFHVLRRQMVRNYRKPIIIVGPKMLLRLPAATSSLADMAPGTHFHPVIGDPHINPDSVRRVVFVSGKLYYTLLGEREARGIKDTAIIRLESLCPFPTQEINKELQKYKKAKKFVWSQEEHRNMGAWFFVRPRFENLCSTKLEYAGRGESEVPATGVTQVHKAEAQTLLNQTFTL